jgi:MFS transporter, SP family, sugar:H+ symporter
MIRIRGPTYSEEEIKQEIQEISAFIEIEKELEGSSSYLDCFRGTNLRRTLLTIGSTMCQEFSGISFISGYVLAVMLRALDYANNRI